MSVIVKQTVIGRPGNVRSAWKDGMDQIVKWVREYN